MKEFNNDNKYDFEQDPLFINGQRIEIMYKEHITNNKLTYEIKSDELWYKTGNMFVEYEQFINNKWVPSGIAVTEADIFAYVLKDEDGQIKYAIEMSTKILKERIDKLIKLNRIKFGGKPKTYNGTATKGYIVPLSDIYITDIEVDEYKIENEIKRKQRLKELWHTKKNQK